MAAHRDDLAYHFFTPSEAENLREEAFLRNLLEQMGLWYGVHDPLAGQLVDLQARLTLSWAGRQRVSTSRSWTGWTS